MTLFQNFTRRTIMDYAREVFDTPKSFSFLPWVPKGALLEKDKLDIQLACGKSKKHPFKYSTTKRSKFVRLEEGKMIRPPKPNILHPFTDINVGMLGDKVYYDALPLIKQRGYHDINTEVLLFRNNSYLEQSNLMLRLHKVSGSGTVIGPLGTVYITNSFLTVWYRCVYGIYRLMTLVPKIKLHQIGFEENECTNYVKSILHKYNEDAFPEDVILNMSPSRIYADVLEHMCANHNNIRTETNVKSGSTHLLFYAFDA